MAKVAVDCHETPNDSGEQDDAVPAPRLRSTTAVSGIPQFDPRTGRAIVLASLALMPIMCSHVWARLGNGNLGPGFAAASTVMAMMCAVGTALLQPTVPLGSDFFADSGRRLLSLRRETSGILTSQSRGRAACNKK